MVKEAFEILDSKPAVPWLVRFCYMELYREKIEKELYYLSCKQHKFDANVE